MTAAASGGQAQERQLDRSGADDSEGDSAAAPNEPAPSIADPDNLDRMKPLAVSSDTFAADAERYRGMSQREQDPADESQDFACDLVAPGDGVLVPVLYDGMEAVLAYRTPTDDAQVVDLLQCGTGDVLRTTTLPVP